mmetsp:Transcript_2987/g.6911  ORF Transcript_2987/g.6911 Transcript_2987/m.6911 type:complete len:144 (-) Transcript_2987:276-707(-)
MTGAADAGNPAAAPAPAQDGAGSSGSGSGGPLSWLVRPADQINYNFISLMYGGCCALAVLLYTLERSLRDYYIPSSSITTSDTDHGGQSSPGNGVAEDSAMVEFTRQMEGLYLVFLPFFPCLLWSLIVRSKWLAGVRGKEKKE